jgi:hypothetical protein
MKFWIECKLFWAIQALLQPAYEIFLFFDLIPLWLLHINLFLQISMEKSVFTSSCSRCKSSTATRLKIVLIEVILTIGENISSKSIRLFCANHFTTSLALYFFLPPSSSFNVPSLVIYQGIHFLFHALLPLIFSVYLHSSS